MSAVVLAMAALLLQVWAVPQNLIPVFSVPRIAASSTAPPSAGAVPEADSGVESGAPQPEKPPADFRSQPVPGVSYVPGRVKLEPVVPATPGAEALPSVESPAAAAPGFLSTEAEAQAEKRRVRIWRILGVAQHSAAMFDAWSTRRAITSGRGRELNPLLRPFAGNASLYVAIQAGPVLLDYIGHRMMTSRHGWIRRTWWVPQALGTAMSLASGFHNLGVSSAAVP